MRVCVKDIKPSAKYELLHLIIAQWRGDECAASMMERIILQFQSKRNENEQVAHGNFASTRARALSRLLRRLLHMESR